MEFRKLNEETVDAYLSYLRRAMDEEPEMMLCESVDENGIRNRVRDPFYCNTVSLLAMENGEVLGRIEYHFYGCMQDGYRMAYVDWVYVLKEHRHKGIAQGLFRAFEADCAEHTIHQYFLIRAENENADRFYRAFSDATLEMVPTVRKQLMSDM